MIYTMTHKTYGVSKDLIPCATFDEFPNKKINFSPLIYPDTKNCDDFKAHEDRGPSAVIVLLSQDFHGNSTYDIPIHTQIYFWPPEKFVNGKYIDVPESFRFDRKSIHLDYITEAGKNILPLTEGVKLDLGDENFVYEETYNPSVFSPPMKVHVSFDMSLQGKTIHVEKSFPVEMATEYEGRQLLEATLKNFYREIFKGNTNQP